MAPRGMSGATARVAVVGAGLSGLAATVALARTGARVELFERTRLLGGKATSFNVEGIEVDNGQHVVLACCTEFLDFANAVGMRSALHLQDRFEVTILSRTRPPAQLQASRLPAPLHLLMSFGRYPLLRADDKLRIARALLAARSRSVASGGDMAAWLARHGQTPTTRRAFWDPFLVPALNAPLEQASAADGVFVIRTAFLSAAGAARIGYATVPLARIAEAAAAYATAVHVRRAITGLQVDDGVLTGLHTEDGVASGFDAAVIAVPPRRLSAILGQPEELGVEGLDDFRTQPIVDVHLWFSVAAEERLLGDSGFAALLDSPVQWVFEKAAGYLCCSLSAAGDTVMLPESELVERCRQELEAVLPRLRGLNLVRSAATRDADATFLPSPGLRRPGPGTALPNVFIAGAWTDTGWPATMESAVRSGRTAAARVVDAIATRRAQRDAPAEVAHAV